MLFFETTRRIPTATYHNPCTAVDRLFRSYFFYYFFFPLLIIYDHSRSDKSARGCHRWRFRGFGCGCDARCAPRGPPIARGPTRGSPPHPPPRPPPTPIFEPFRVSASLKRHVERENGVCTDRRTSSVTFVPKGLPSTPPPPCQVKLHPYTNFHSKRANDGIQRHGSL